MQHVKLQRRQQRVDKQARRDGDAELVQKVIRLQSVLDGITPDTRDDFLAGSNGAVVCSLLFLSISGFLHPA